MSQDSFDLDVLSDNLRCKIIYYSCINPHTISDLNREWGYNSPTYLYQKDALQKLKDANLITVEKDEGKNIITSNYEALFSEENVERSMEKVNREILREFLIHSKGFHSDTHTPQDKEVMLNMGRDNLEMELEENLRMMEFGEEEYRKLIKLWRRDLFKEVFLSLEVLTRLFKDRKKDLPDNPLIFLFRLTSGATHSISKVRKEKGVEIPSGMKYRFEKVVVPVYRTLKGKYSDGSGYDDFRNYMKDVFSLFRTKFRDEKFDYSFMEQFAEMTVYDESEEKLGNFLQKFRGENKSRFFG